MAPGLFHHKQPSIQSDLYALGIVLYEVVTGQEPFGGVPADGLQAAVELVPPSVLCPEIEPALERAILQCLEEDPSPAARIGDKRLRPSCPTTTMGTWCPRFPS